MPELPRNMHADYFFKTIDELYQEELMGEIHESKEKTVTFNFPVEDAYMFSAIAKRFNRSNASFGGEVFAEGVRMLFLALSAEDRHKLAAEADAEIAEYLGTKGWSNVGNRWTSYARICDEHDLDAKEGQPK